AATAGADPGRQAARAGGNDGQALRAESRDSDNRRSRLPRLRGAGLERRPGRRGDAGGDRAAPERRDQRDPQGSRRQSQAQCTGVRAYRRNTGRLRPADQERLRQVGAGDRQDRRPDRLARRVDARSPLNLRLLPRPRPMHDVKKVVLAYSGGLDTSVILRWLQDTYGCEVVTFTADIGQGEELAPARAKAAAAGVKQIFIDDLREEFVRDFVFPMFRANAIYEGEYLLGTSIARPLIAKRQIEIA